MAEIDFLSEYSSEVNSWIDNYMSSKNKPHVVYGLIKEFLSLGGKRFRPALCMISAEMLGKKKNYALPVSCSIELFHNFTLIHDDIEDGSEIRRGKPCLHHKYGIPLAINAGDGLFILVWDILSNLPYDFETCSRLQKMLVSTYRKVLDGQGIELSWIKENKWDIKERDYYAMVYGKTASLIEGALVAGGIIAQADDKMLRALSEFGKLIGIGFQIQDDYLNIVGDEKKYKKEIGGDITEGKRTLMTIHALSNLSGSDAAKLKKILSMHTRDHSLILEAIHLLKKAGSTEYAKQKAEKCINDALEIASTSFPKNLYSKRLIEIAKYLVSRES